MQPFEKYPLSRRLISIWLEENIIHKIGSIKVVSNGGDEAWVDDGIYSVKKGGFSRQVHKTPYEQLEIIETLLYKYADFERNGYKYRYFKGEWLRTKVEKHFH